MQFDINEKFGNLGSSISIIDVSGESEEEFTAEPGNVQARDERFRVGGTSTDAMPAFVGAATATLFLSPSFPHQSEDLINTSRSQIERQLMNLVEEHQNHEKSRNHHSLIQILRNHQHRRTIRKWTTISQ